MGESLKKKLRIAVIGCGRISPMHLGSIAMLGEELVAVCDTKRERAEEAAKKYGGAVYTDYIEMLDREKLDAVHLCLPHYIHCKVAEQAIMRGVAVLSEKPMDISYEAAEHAMLFAKEKGVPFGVVSQCRYNNSAVLVKKAITSGKLGRIISARSILTWKRANDYYLESDWKGTWDKEGGGVVIDQAIHSIDLVNWMINSEVTSLSANLSKRGNKVCEVEDTAEGFITYESGAVYGFYCMNNYAVDEPIEIMLQCERGKAVFGYDDAVITYNDGTVEQAHQDFSAEYDGGKDYWGCQHVRQVRQFYAAVRGEEPLDISAEEALKTHKIVMEIYKLGKKGMGL